MNIYLTHDDPADAEQTHTVVARSAHGLDAIEVTLRVDRGNLTPATARLLLDKTVEALHSHLNLIDPTPMLPGFSHESEGSRWND